MFLRTSLRGFGVSRIFFHILPERLLRCKAYEFKQKYFFLGFQNKSSLHRYCGDYIPVVKCFFVHFVYFIEVVALWSKYFLVNNIYRFKCLYYILIYSRLFDQILQILGVKEWFVHRCSLSENLKKSAPCSFQEENLWTYLW